MDAGEQLVIAIGLEEIWSTAAIDIANPDEITSTRLTAARKKGDEAYEIYKTLNHKMPYGFSSKDVPDDDSIFRNHYFSHYVPNPMDRQMYVHSRDYIDTVLANPHDRKPRFPELPFPESNVFTGRNIVRKIIASLEHLAIELRPADLKVTALAQLRVTYLKMTYLRLHRLRDVIYMQAQQPKETGTLVHDSLETSGQIVAASAKAKILMQSSYVSPALYKYIADLEASYEILHRYGDFYAYERIQGRTYRNDPETGISYLPLEPETKSVAYIANESERAIVDDFLSPILKKTSAEQRARLDSIQTGEFIQPLVKRTMGVLALLVIVLCAALLITTPSILQISKN